MKILAMLALMMAPVVAGELMEVAEVSKEAVAGSREVTFVYGEHKEVLHLVGPAMLTSSDVGKVSVGTEPTAVAVKLTEEGAKKFSKKTTGMEGKRIAVLVKGKVITAPILRTAPLGGNFEINGFKDEAEAKEFVEAFGKR